MERLRRVATHVRGAGSAGDADVESEVESDTAPAVPERRISHLKLHEAIVRGSLERLVPILMTALTAALALVPIVLEGDRPGNEILSPLSVVILGGLLTSTFLNLVVVPAGYAAIHRDRTPNAAPPLSGDTP